MLLYTSDLFTLCLTHIFMSFFPGAAVVQGVCIHQTADFNTIIITNGFFFLKFTLRQNLGYISLGNIIVHYLNALNWCFMFDQGLADPLCAPFRSLLCIQYMHGSLEYHIFEYIILTAHLSEYISAYEEVLSRR